MSTKRPENSGGSARAKGGKSSGGDAARGASGSGRTVLAQPDVGEIARAVSTAFIILVFGALLQPVAGMVLPLAIGQFWLIVVALVGFTLAGVRCGRAGPIPPLYGAGGALIAFALVVPLQFIQGTFDPLYAIYTTVAALVIGAVAGEVGARVGSSS